MQKLIAQILLGVGISIVTASIMASANSIVQVRVQEERIEQMQRSHERELKIISDNISDIKSDLKILIQERRNR
jgi:hypothetical protein